MAKAKNTVTFTLTELEIECLLHGLNHLDGYNPMWKPTYEKRIKSIRKKLAELLID